MITSVSNQKCFQFMGLSTDTKPTDHWVGNGSTFFEIDTAKAFVYDEENTTWVEVI